MTEVQQVMLNYQQFTPSTAVYPGKGTQLEEIYLCLGLMGEYQEWLLSDYNVKEAGDIFWYCSQLCNIKGFDLYDVYLKSEANGISVNINLPERLKKSIRDGIDIKYAILEYMKSVIRQVKYRYTYFNSGGTLGSIIIATLVANRDKLIDRQNRGMIKGEGDER